MEPGTIVCDMSGSNLRATFALRFTKSPTLHDKYEVRSIIEWRLAETDDNGTTQRPQLWQWLNGICHAHGRHGYTNKLLIVVGGPIPCGERWGLWYPCAYSYDGVRAGMCEVRRRD